MQLELIGMDYHPLATVNTWDAKPGNVRAIILRDDANNVITFVPEIKEEKVIRKVREISE